MGSSPSQHQVERFVHKLLITGAWLDEVVSGLGAELPRERYPGEAPPTVVFQMWCGAIGTAVQSADLRDLRGANELIDLVVSQTEERLRLVCDPSGRIHWAAAVNGRADD